MRERVYSLSFVFCFTFLLFLLLAVGDLNAQQIKVKQVEKKYQFVKSPKSGLFLNVWQEFSWRNAQGKKVNITRIRYRQVKRDLEFEIYLKSANPNRPFLIPRGVSLYIWSLLPDGFTMADFRVPLTVRRGSRIYREGNHLPPDEGVVEARWKNPPLLAYIGSFKVYVGIRLTPGTPKPGYLAPDSCAVSPVRTVPRKFHLPWPPKPTISSVSPTRAKEGKVITIRGKDLPYDFWHRTPGMKISRISHYGYAKVFFHDVNVGGTKEREGEILSFSYKEMKVRVPQEAETGPVRLKYSVFSWGAREFSTPIINRLVVLKPPEISKVEPAPAAPGEKVVIRGNNFWDQSRGTSRTRVLFGDKEMPFGGSPGYLSLYVPNLPPGRYKVTVSNRDGEDSAYVQLILRPPVIKSVFPREGRVGDVIFIYSKNIDLWEGSTRVYINGVPAEILEMKERAGFKDVSVKVRIPKGASSGPISIYTKWGKTDSLKSDPPFTFNIVK